MNKYFGPAKFCKLDEEQVAPPVGEACVMCEEPVVAADIGTISAAGQVEHYACRMRAITGSVGHQMGRCSCFGGSEEDPPGMTRKQAAEAATALWHKMQGDG